MVRGSSRLKSCKNEPGIGKHIVPGETNLTFFLEISNLAIFYLYRAWEMIIHLKILQLLPTTTTETNDFLCTISRRERTPRIEAHGCSFKKGKQESTQISYNRDRCWSAVLLAHMRVRACVGACVGMCVCVQVRARSYIRGCVCVRAWVCVCRCVCACMQEHTCVGVCGCACMCACLR